jgi:signal transduction histidine kinase
VQTRTVPKNWVLKYWHDWASRLSGARLTTQFLATGGLLMLLAMALAGLLINTLAHDHTIRGEAAATALFIQSIASPLAQELVNEDRLSPKSREELDRLFEDADFSNRFPHLEIWTPTGAVAYSRSPDLIGQRFTISDSLRQALQGDIVATFSDITAREHVVRGVAIRHLEIYSPLRDQSTGRIIAVAEIHEATEPLAHNLQVLSLQVWSIVAFLTLLIMAGLFGIVHRGSQTIEQQSKDLAGRIREAETMLKENIALKDRAERASGRVAELNERFLRGIGADLHDGPAQLISYSILKLDQLRRSSDPGERSEILRNVEDMMSEAMREIRTISKGMLLPEIDHLPLHEAIERAVKLHEARTSTTVGLSIKGPTLEVVPAVKICAYRFVQEGLANAFRHAGGKDQRVECLIQGKVLSLAVCDRGQGAFALTGVEDQTGLGLEGLRLRVESIGGTLTLHHFDEVGSRIEMRLDFRGGLALA